MPPLSEWFTVLLCCQLPTDFNNISIVSGVSASGVGSPRMIYGMQWCASNHPVCLSVKSGYQWCTCVRVAYTAKCILEWAGGQDRTYWFQRRLWYGQPCREFSISYVLWILVVLCETILFPQDMIQDIYKLHWNIIHKSTGVTWNVSPYKLTRLPGHGIPVYIDTVSIKSITAHYGELL